MNRVAEKDDSVIRRGNHKGYEWCIKFHPWNTQYNYYNAYVEAQINNTSWIKCYDSISYHDDSCIGFSSGTDCKTDKALTSQDMEDECIKIIGQLINRYDDIKVALRTQPREVLLHFDFQNKLEIIAIEECMPQLLILYGNLQKIDWDSSKQIWEVVHMMIEVLDNA